MEWEFGASRCKLLHLEWISNEVLLYSTRNDIQSLVMECDRKEYEKKYVYLGHFAVQNKLTEHCNTIF